ncbi:hypothetical protein [Thalassotalea sp. ND16A]|uniref:hypothetical protein n=1 Tax=Thalassotalea sp. ND16A TaxID=1535422 RepID=UPI00051A5157|nr:hypothetical protein [Thalassotalea sp. ND16A]KGK00652.1 hypothetical protein ND16A_3412 [Thalassotalea sp. ND16A]
MHIFEFVIIVMVCVGIFQFLKQRQKIQADSQHTSKQQSAMDDELAQLKARVAILEKIVTDKGYDLKQEIDDL